MKGRVGRPPGKTHPEVFVLRLPKGTLRLWRSAAKRDGTSVSELVRRRIKKGEKG